ncbi:putative disease resistance RPP13-like protein 1 [Carex rostrata]
MASALFSSIQSLSTDLLKAIRGTPSTSHHHDPSSPVTDQHKSVRKDLEKLNRMLTRIQAVQQDAEEREIYDRSVRLWLEELRGVAYQAEDVLDEFNYEVLRSIVESGDAAIEAYHRDRGNKSKVEEKYPSSALASPSSFITKISIPSGMAEKIKCITERFEEISNDRHALQLREEDGTRLVIGPQIRPPTSSHVDKRAIFGREEEKEKIISLLNASNGPDFMVLPIVGMGGFGKTTLAQLVFNDSRIHGLFNKRCWVCVSDDFDLVRLTKAIVESVSHNPCEFSELSKLQDVLKENIRGLGLFLVLDDVWNEKRNLWECFRVGFLGAKFVRILTTTRNTSVAKIMQTSSRFQLRSLPEENCWSLFKHFAFGNRELSENANLHEIGRGIVKKCKGSPLAIKALGGILRYEMGEEKWREILESDISEIDEMGEVMPALRLSYQKLPQHLKPCFLYLSMFPKGRPFGINMVVRLWMAQGYINGNTRNLKTLEEIGSEYFDELQGRSLVDDGRWGYYILHDLIHDLARSISQEAYQPFLENDQECNGPCKVCHLYFTKQDELLGSFFVPNDYCSIRTFVKRYWPEENFDFAISYEFACVRALELRFSLFPNTLGTLKHLRYLSIGNSHMETLPETLCLLYNLQTLNLDCSELQELPESIKNLINLRHLSIGSNSRMEILPETLCLLYNLQTLDLKTSYLRKLPENIKNLINLRHLSINSQMKILPETLCLLYNLQTLDLNTFYLRKLPENIKNLINLQYFSLTSDNIQHLPESIFPLPSLQTLSLRYGHKLKELPRGIEQSTRLHILDLPIHTNMPSEGLRVLKDMNKLRGSLCISGLRNIVDGELCRNANLASKPNLHKLILNFQEYCSKWSFRILNFQKYCSIEELHLHLTDHSRNDVKSENDEKIHNVVLQSLQPHGNLTELAILHFGGRNFPSWLLNPLLPKLTTLILKFCTEPNFLPPFGQLPYLRILKISGSTGVRNLGDEPSTYSLLVEYDSSEQPKKPSYPSLEVLSLRNMLNLVEWQANDGDFPCLKELVLENCEELWKIPTIPRNVKDVTFKDCPKLKFATCPSVIRNLKIMRCGFLEIMFHSVSENLTISNCVELKLINWSYRGLNYIKQVSFEYCPKLELIAIPVRAFKLKIHECGFHEIKIGSIPESLTISNCVELISINWMDTESLTIKIGSIPESLNSVRKVSFEHCPKLELHVPLKNLLHSTYSAEIYDCPRLYLGERYVYKRDTTIKRFHLFRNNAINLSDSVIPLLENQFKLFFTKEDFREVESLTCAASVGVSCQHVILNLASLVKLKIRCTKVISVTGLDNLSNLKRLSISYCPKLCNWNDKTLPLSLKFLELDSCDKLSSMPMLSVQNHSSILKVLVIKKCPRLAVLEGCHGLMKLNTVELLHCGNIRISPATESLCRPRINIGDCPLMRDWCQRNNITYNELIVNPQDDREAELESCEQENSEQESSEQQSGERKSGEIGEQGSGEQKNSEQKSGE